MQKQINLNTKLLNKQTLYELLSQRFESEEKKLSEIPNPALLQDAQKSAKRIADAVRNNEKITVAEFEFTKENGIKFIKSIPESKLSKDIWNINYKKRKAQMLSYQGEGKRKPARYKNYVLNKVYNIMRVENK